MKILFLIRSLGTGGAERQLVTLATALQKKGHTVLVACLYDVKGPLKDQLKEAKVTYHVFSKKSRWDILGFGKNLLTFVRQISPDILHSYMPLQNILALCLKPFIPSKVVCGVRIAMPDLSAYDWFTRLTYWLEAKLIRFSDGVISNSQAALDLYTKRQHRTDHFHVIPNGVDFAKFILNPDLGILFRKKNNIPDDLFLIGSVGRFDPQKNYPAFLRGARTLLDQRQDVSFICVGDMNSPEYKNYKALSNQLGLQSHILWFDKQSDMSSVYSALDALCLMSQFEGFPNVLVEALSCGTLCLSTDVGDASLILDHHSLGKIISTDSPAAMAQSLETLMQQEQSKTSRDRLDDGRKRRKNVQKRFSVENLVYQTEQVMKRILNG
tara:strand:- start:150 stop:1295 length:1146 start_codon:yes stop_codon:yes gene_type:complete